MIFDPLRFRSIRFPVAVPLLSSFFPLFSNFWFVLRRFPAGISAVVLRSPACASPTPSRFGVRSRPAPRLVRPPPPPVAMSNAPIHLRAYSGCSRVEALDCAAAELLEPRGTQCDASGGESEMQPPHARRQRRFRLVDGMHV